MYLNCKFALVLVPLLTGGRFPVLVLPRASFAQLVSSGVGQRVVSHDDRAKDENMGLLGKLKAKIDREAPIIDLVGSIFAIAEVAMEGANAEVLEKRPELGFFKKDALARQVVGEMNRFVKGLPKMVVPWHLATIEVYVTRDSGPSGPEKITTLSQLYCIPKGDLMDRFKDPDKRIGRNASGSTSLPEQEGVLVHWVEERSEQAQNTGGGKNADARAGASSGSNVSATLRLTFVAFDKKEFQKRTKVIQAKYKTDLRWELLTR